MTGRGSQPASVPPWNPNKPAAPTPPVGSAPRTSPTTVATEPRPHTSSNQPDVISREILDLYDPDAINATSQTNLVDTVPDYPMDSLPRGSSARSLANTNNQPSSSVNQSENVRTSQNSNSSSRTPQTSTGSAVRTNSNSAPRTNTNSAPRTSTNSAPRTSSSSAPRTSSSSAPRTSTSSDPNQTVGPVPSSVVTNTGLLPQAHPVTLAPRNLVPAHTQVYTVSHSTHSTSIPAVSHANVSVNINHAALPSIPVGTATTSSDTRHIRTQNLNVGVVTSRLDHIRQSGGALPDVVAHSQPSARTPSSSQRPPLPTIDPRAAQGHSSHRSGERDPHSRHHSRHPRDNRHSRPRRHSHRQTPPGVEEPCKESCLKCLAAGMSFRWILVVLSLLGVCCVVTGIVLAALHAAGNSFLFLAIMFIDSWNQSDNFFKKYLRLNTICDDNEIISTEITDSDGFVADEFYVVLDKVYQYSSTDDLNAFVKEKQDILKHSRAKQYLDLKEQCRTLGHNKFESVLTTSQFIRFVQLYDGISPVVKLCVTINKDFGVEITVHGRSLPASHEILSRLPHMCYNIADIKLVLNEVSEYRVCTGNSDSKFQNLIPGLQTGAFVDISGEASWSAYQENIAGVASIRSVNCNFLIKGYERCKCCAVYRRTLTKAEFRKKNKIETPKKNWLKTYVGNNRLSESQKVQKLKQFRSYAGDLENEVLKLSRQLKNSIRQKGVLLSNIESKDLCDLMDEAESQIKKSYPDSSAYQRLLWDQQKKYNTLKDKRGMRWHPMIIKWCIYLKSKSSATYDVLKNSGFISLPSEKTLYDYTHVIKKGTGFREDIVAMCFNEIYSEGFEKVKPYTKIVGLLQDEIRIKSDLVYNKHTGELVGFIDLDSVGNDLLNIKESLKKEAKSLAKYVLVIMVRGLGSRLTFPLAHFATCGITSDQLFPLLWKAVEICELDLGLQVLFITSDGASPNRRFIKIHRQEGDVEVTYKADNVFAIDERQIYFISDVPHLIKTIRNNFSNSHSHKNTRKLWKNGKDISWMQIVNLYKDYCSGHLRVCPKLSRAHIDISSFGCMKVNLAAQVMSTTVANALELYYEQQTSETVKFIRLVDKYFDCLNTRHLYEGARTLKANMEPFTSVGDPRLTFLTGEFLNFFREWRQDVENRHGDLSKSQKAAMQLSYQTLEGIEITSRSIVECVKFCLEHGMPFVLTEKFNQDPIEQHFGVHRTSGGCNTNPSVDQFDNSMVTLRQIGSQALAPVRGNTKRRLELPGIDNTPLAKRQRRSSM